MPGTIHPDDLARIHARLAFLEGREHRRQRRRGRCRRPLALALVALLLALVPAGLFAADPVFSDLGEAAEAHRANIQAIGNAGITTGFQDPANPGQRAYNPKGPVTREEMASFLARTAGLGGNPPVVNAAQLGGQPASAYLPADGDTVLRYPGMAVQAYSNGTMKPAAAGGGGGIFPYQGLGATAVFPLPRPTMEHGRPLAIKGLRICYEAQVAGITIDGLFLDVAEQGSEDSVVLIFDGTVRGATDATCYDLSVPMPRVTGGTTYLYFVVHSTASAIYGLYLHSVELTLTPLPLP